MSPVTLEQAAAFMEAKTTTADDVGMIPYFGLHIGGGGSGKTTALGSLPAPLLIIQADGKTGTLPLKDRDDIHVVEVNSWPDVQMVLRFLFEGKHPYKSIGVDNLTRLQHFNSDHILKEHQKNFMSRDLWGVLLNNQIGFVEFIRTVSNRCNAHVAVTVLESIIFDQDGTPRGAFPDLKGGFRDKVAPMFDTVVYHRTKQLPPVEDQEFGEIKYACLTRPYTINEIPRDLARSRWDCLDIMEPMNKSADGSPWGISNWIERAWQTLSEEQKKNRVGTPPPEEQDAVTGEPITKPVAGVKIEEEMLQKALTEPVQEVPPKRGRLDAAMEKAQPNPMTPEPEPEPENVAAAEELASSAADTNGGPPALELQKMIEAWYDGIVQRFPNQEQAIQEKLVGTVTKHGVGRLADLKDQEKLNEIIEELAKYEATLS